MVRYSRGPLARAIQAKLGFVSVTALLCVSAPANLSAQTAQPAAPQPASVQRPGGGTSLPTVAVDAQRRRPSRRQRPTAPVRVRAPAPVARSAPPPSPPPAPNFSTPA